MAVDLVNLDLGLSEETLIDFDAKLGWEIEERGRHRGVIIVGIGGFD
jgi:hypothetical protein